MTNSILYILLIAAINTRFNIVLYMHRICLYFIAITLIAQYIWCFKLKFAINRVLLISD